MQLAQRIILVLTLAIAGVSVYAQTQNVEKQEAIAEAATIEQSSAKLGMSQRLGDIEVEQTGEQYLITVKTSDGVKTMTPDQFAAKLHAQQEKRNWLFEVMNITSAMGIAWVALGLLGQVLFTGRMIVQWIVSEKEKRSIVPVAFWWMSITGATMLLIYFVWRRDIVGVIGQGTGWFIYVRNLRFIYSSKYGGKDRVNPPSTGDDATD